MATHEALMIAQVARQKLLEAIEEHASIGSNHLVLACVAVTQMFSDLINGISTQSGIVEIVNQTLKPSGLELVERRT